AGEPQRSATGGEAQSWELDIRGGNGEQSTLEVRPVPETYRWAPLQGPGTNVAQAYAHVARDYREGTHLCPTFDDAVTRHRMLDAIETAAATGERQTLRTFISEASDHHLPPYLVAASPPQTFSAIRR